jgi:hypothetical protein
MHLVGSEPGLDFALGEPLQLFTGLIQDADLAAVLHHGEAGVEEREHRILVLEHELGSRRLPPDVLARFLDPLVEVVLRGVAASVLSRIFVGLCGSRHEHAFQRLRGRIETEATELGTGSLVDRRVESVLSFRIADPHQMLADLRDLAIELRVGSRSARCSRRSGRVVLRSRTILRGHGEFDEPVRRLGDRDLLDRTALRVPVFVARDASARRRHHEPAVGTGIDLSPTTLVVFRRSTPSRQRNQ